MILEDFIKYLEDQIIMVHELPPQFLGRKLMQDVLVYQSSTDPERWSATDWPTQRLVAQGVTRDDAISAFVNGWNIRMRDNKTTADFRFFGPLLVTAYLEETPNGWNCSAHAETIYTVGPFPTEDEAKTAFLTLWNAEHPDDDPVSDINIDWQYSNAPE